jgi:outer membrane protein
MRWTGDLSVAIPQPRGSDGARFIAADTTLRVHQRWLQCSMLQRQQLRHDLCEASPAPSIALVSGLTKRAGGYARSVGLVSWLTIATGAAHAQSLRIGYVDLGRIMTESTPAQAARSRAELALQPRLEAAKKMEAELNAAVAAASPAMQGADPKDRWQQDLALARKKLEWQRVQTMLVADLERRRTDESQRLYASARDAIQAIGEQGHYDAILESSVYAKPEADLTERIISILESGQLGKPTDR